MPNNQDWETINKIIDYVIKNQFSSSTTLHEELSKILSSEIEKAKEEVVIAIGKKLDEVYDLRLKYHEPIESNYYNSEMAIRNESYKQFRLIVKSLSKKQESHE